MKGFQKNKDSAIEALQHSPMNASGTEINLPPQGANSNQRHEEIEPGNAGTGNSSSNDSRPILWVRDALAASKLQILFQLYEYQEIKTELPAGEHYIHADEDTPEEIVKTIGWKVEKAGFTCNVHCTNQPLESLVGSERAARELVDQIIEFAQSLEDWSVRNDDTSLTIKQASEVATAALLHLEDPEKTIELQTLGKRCKQSSWDWGRLIGKLEEELHRKALERGVPVSTTSDDGLDEKLRLELLALLKETDKIKYHRKLSKICSFYRLTKDAVKECLQYLEQSTKVAEVKCYGLDEFLSQETKGFEWLIPGLLPRAETIILAGSPKVGKTSLSIDAALALATGESSFLGETVKRRKVLYVSSDESPQSTRHKLLKRGFRQIDDGSIKIMTGWDISQMGELEKQLEDFRPDVVIIDSLKRIFIGSQISENSAEFADAIYTLKETIGRYNASGILIHHTNKSLDTTGVHKLRGSSAIAGAVWGTWQLEHIPKKDPNDKRRKIIDPKDPRRVLSVFARDTEGQRFDVEFNPENNSFTRIVSPEADEMKTSRERILKILQRNVKGLSGRGIIECLGMTPEEGRGVYTELNRMVNKLLINCKPAPGDKRVNIYSLPDNAIFGDTPPPILSYPIDNKSAEVIDIQGIDHTQQNTQQAIVNIQQGSLLNIPENSIKNGSNQDTASVIELLNNTTTNGGGEGVLENSTECNEQLLDQLQDTETTAVLKKGDQVQYVGNQKQFKSLKRKQLVVTVIDSNGIWVKPAKGFGCCFGPMQEMELRLS